MRLDPRSPLSRTLILLAFATWLSGCGDGDGGSPSGWPYRSGSSDSGTNDTATATTTNTLTASGTVNLDGDWRGSFLNAVTGGRQSVTAHISQSGRQVTISTNLQGLGGLFTGRITSSNNLILIDASDGQEWTTHSGPATKRHVVIQDYVTLPKTGDLGLNTIELDR